MSGHNSTILGNLHTCSLIPSPHSTAACYTLAKRPTTIEGVERRSSPRIEELDFQPSVMAIGYNDEAEKL